MNILKLKKLNKLVMHHMHEILMKDVVYSKNLFTLTRVEISKNLSIINIYVLTQNDYNGKLIKYFNSKKIYLRHLLLKKVNFNNAPNIFFYFDYNFLVSLNLDDSLDNISHIK